MPSLWSSVSGVAQFSVQKPAAHLQLPGEAPGPTTPAPVNSHDRPHEPGAQSHRNAPSPPNRLTQTPPFWHGLFQQESKVRAQPVPQLMGQASDAATPVLSSTAPQSASHDPIYSMTMEHVMEPQMMKSGSSSHCKNTQHASRWSHDIVM